MGPPFIKLASLQEGPFCLSWGPDPILCQPAAPRLLLCTASLSTRRTWSNGFDSKGRTTKIRSKVASMHPLCMPLAWAFFRLRGRTSTAKSGKPQFEQGRRRRKHMCVRKGKFIIKQWWFKSQSKRRRNRRRIECIILSNGREGPPLLKAAACTGNLGASGICGKNMRASMTSLFSFLAEVIYCIIVLYIILLSHPLPHHAAANRGMPLESQAPERV